MSAFDASNPFAQPVSSGNFGAPAPPVFGIPFGRVMGMPNPFSAPMGAAPRASMSPTPPMSPSPPPPPGPIFNLDRLSGGGLPLRTQSPTSPVQSASVPFVDPMAALNLNANSVVPVADPPAGMLLRAQSPPPQAPSPTQMISSPVLMMSPATAASRPVLSSPSPLPSAQQQLQQADTSAQMQLQHKNRTIECWFAGLDQDGDGRLTGRDCRDFLVRSGLPQEILARVWAVSDSNRNGYLDVRLFGRAMDLMALAQAGQDPTQQTLLDAMTSGSMIPLPQGFPECVGDADGAYINVEQLQMDAHARRSTGPGTRDDGGMGAIGDAAAALAAFTPGALAMPQDAIASMASMRSDGSFAVPAAEYESRKAGLFSSTRLLQVQEPAAVAGSNGRGRRRRAVPMAVCTSVVDGLKAIYCGRVMRIEEEFSFSYFYSAPLTEADFNAKPLISIFGQYSTGKTTFLRHLLGREYPGATIGPEPTTDKFCVIYGSGNTAVPEDRVVPGHSLAVQTDRPFHALQQFGAGLLGRLSGCQMHHPLLEELSFVDTPGVLAGEKQRTARGYDFVAVTEFLASRSDLILLTFDPHKLDISDEFREVIQALSSWGDKVRIVLNKTDQVAPGELHLISGALYWQLSRVLPTPELPRLHLASFLSGPQPSDADQPSAKSAPAPATAAAGTSSLQQQQQVLDPSLVPILARENETLLRDLKDLPAKSVDKKLSDFVKRLRALRTHVLLMHTLRERLPKRGDGAGAAAAKMQRQVIERLHEVYEAVQRTYRVPASDLPDLERYRAILSTFDLGSFPKVDESVIQSMDELLAVHVPALVKHFENPF